MKLTQNQKNKLLLKYIEDEKKLKRTFVKLNQILKNAE